jgi:hypothetical protein
MRKGMDVYPLTLRYPHGRLKTISEEIWSSPPRFMENRENNKPGYDCWFTGQSILYI